MRRRKRKLPPREVRAFENDGEFFVERGWLRLVKITPWKQVETDKIAGHTISITARLRLEGTVLGSAVPDAWWQLTISRRIDDEGHLSAWFTSYLEYFSEDEDGNIETTSATFSLYSGHCRGWRDVLKTVAEDAPFLETLSLIGQSIYSDPDQWIALRPFKVLWPFRSWDEPNARYSSFHLVSNYPFDPETDGAVASCYQGSGRAALKFAQKLGANAFLTGPHGPDSEYRIYHRNSMQAFDVISIDDYRGRIIAGTRD